MQRPVFHLRTSHKQPTADSMNEQLLLKNIRNVLVRLEDTIIFSLIERSQFKRNSRVYETGAFGAATGEESLTGHMLHETEKVHARMRRYTSPDEHPFFADLPEPVLKALPCRENPLAPNRINVNAAILGYYVDRLVPELCTAGDDGQYGSTAVCDVACLQALSKRTHYGKFVAESKYQDSPAVYDALAAAGDAAGVAREITDSQVEARLFDRVYAKAGSYSGMLLEAERARAFPETVLGVYRDFIVPLTKQVEVAYLLQRCRRQPA